MKPNETDLLAEQTRRAVVTECYRCGLVRCGAHETDCPRCDCSKNLQFVRGHAAAMRQTRYRIVRRTASQTYLIRERREIETLRRDLAAGGGVLVRLDVHRSPDGYYVWSWVIDGKAPACASGRAWLESDAVRQAQEKDLSGLIRVEGGRL